MDDFIRGMGSVLNLYGNNGMNMEVITPPSQSDTEALLSDWQQIGNDLNFAMCEYNKNTK